MELILTNKSLLQRIVHLSFGSVTCTCVFSLVSEFGLWFSMHGSGASTSRLRIALRAAIAEKTCYGFSTPLPFWVNVTIHDGYTAHVDIFSQAMIISQSANVFKLINTRCIMILWSTFRVEDVVRTRVDYRTIIREVKCDDEDIHCCDGLTFIGNQCLSKCQLTFESSLPFECISQSPPVSLFVTIPVSLHYNV